jgi:hypothetical protein
VQMMPVVPSSVCRGSIASVVSPRQVLIVVDVVRAGC